MYGGKNSLVETLSRQDTMDAASSKFASFGAEGEMEESTRWRVPGSHGGSNGPHAKAKVAATAATAAMERAETAVAEARLTPTPTPTLTLALTPTL